MENEITYSAEVATKACKEGYEDGYKKGYEDGFQTASFTGVRSTDGQNIYLGDVVECFDNAAEDADWGLDKKHKGIIELKNCRYILNVDGVYLEHWFNAENIVKR